MMNTHPTIEVDCTLAHSYDPEKHPDNWLASEKLDGVRAIWFQGALLTRNSKVIEAPPGWIAGLPKGLHLDGELFIGRGRFDETSGIVRRRNLTSIDVAAWEGITFQVFDEYLGHGSYRDRLFKIDRLTTMCKRVNVIEQRTITDADHLEAYVDALIKVGAEGAMLRDPSAPYVAGRSRGLLKCKRHYDLDATVVGYEDGKGKHLGRLGALLCATKKNGVQFKCGTGLTDAQRENPPAIGSIITVRYQEMTAKGKPRFPRFVGVRADG